MRVYGGLAPPSPSTTPTQNWVDGHEEQRNADVATLNGVTLKRGPTGLEIVALSEFSAGAAMRSEGFLVGDTLTAVGGADVVGRSPGVFFAWIVEEDSGSGVLTHPIPLPARSIQFYNASSPMTPLVCTRACRLDPVAR